MAQIENLHKRKPHTHTIANTPRFLILGLNSGKETLRVNVTEQIPGNDPGNQPCFYHTASSCPLPPHRGLPGAASHPVHRAALALGNGKGDGAFTACLLHRSDAGIPAHSTLQMRKPNHKYPLSRNCETPAKSLTRAPAAWPQHTGSNVAMLRCVHPSSMTTFFHLFNHPFNRCLLKTASQRNEVKNSIRVYSTYLLEMGVKGSLTWGLSWESFPQGHGQNKAGTMESLQQELPLFSLNVRALFPGLRQLPARMGDRSS